MADESVRKKRKRSAVACIGCHRRKVRCNVSWQGIPCSNCVEDGVSCNIYRKETQLPKRRSDSTAEGPLLSPSSSITQGTALRQTSPIRGSTEDTYESETPPQYTPQGLRRDSSNVGQYANDRYNSARPAPPTATEDGKQEVRPFFAGESEGLEFLFDLCAPDRPARGLHYATPAERYRAKRPNQKPARPLPPVPPIEVQRELVRCFFLHVWPVLPVVDAKEFLTSFYSQEPAVSPLLLWSVFFAAVSFVDQEALKHYRLPSRKALKEQYYQCAKAIFDAQEEPEKTILIQSALLLASSWYIDLEDRDGMCHWLGVAISLAFTIGLHRKDNYDTMTPCPFPKSIRRLWKCIWWSIVYREAFTGLGFGRPMRVDSEDCDVPIPSVQEVYGSELDDLPDYMLLNLPRGLMEMATLWINLLELGLLLERVLKRHYRPRSTSVTIVQLEEEERAILSCRDRLMSLRVSDSSYLALHAAHLKTYYNSVLIALYRPYMPLHPDRSEHLIYVSYQDIPIKAKRAAAGTTSVLNELISRNAIGTAPSMLVTATMSAMQVYVWEVRHSSGLARKYAYHQLELYLMVLSQLGKTYWTADLQHNLFVEALKVINGGRPGPDKEGTEPQSYFRSVQNVELPSAGSTELNQPENTLMQWSLEDFLPHFNPFMGLPMHGDEISPSVDLELNTPGPLMVDDLGHGRA